MHSLKCTSWLCSGWKLWDDWLQTLQEYVYEIWHKFLFDVIFGFSLFELITVSQTFKPHEHMHLHWIFKWERLQRTLLIKSLSFKIGVLKFAPRTKLRTDFGHATLPLLRRIVLFCLFFFSLTRIWMRGRQLSSKCDLRPRPVEIGFGNPCPVRLNTFQLVW